MIGEKAVPAFAEIWINIGGFLLGMVLGGLILLLTFQKIKKNIKDPWEETDEQDREFEEEQEHLKEQTEER